MDWENAEKYLAACEKAYAEIGSAGYFALTAVIRPLRDRFNGGGCGTGRKGLPGQHPG